jgi:hypothetical protein
MKRHKDYTLTDQAHGVCHICLAPAEVECDCELDEEIKAYYKKQLKSFLNSPRKVKERFVGWMRAINELEKCRGDKK